MLVPPVSKLSPVSLVLKMSWPQSPPPRRLSEHISPVTIHPHAVTDFWRPHILHSSSCTPHKCLLSNNETVRIATHSIIQHAGQLPRFARAFFKGNLCQRADLLAVTHDSLLDHADWLELFSRKVSRHSLLSFYIKLFSNHMLSKPSFILYFYKHHLEFVSWLWI